MWTVASHVKIHLIANVTCEIAGRPLTFGRGSARESLHVDSLCAPNGGRGGGQDEATGPLRHIL